MPQEVYFKERYDHKGFVESLRREYTTYFLILVYVKNKIRCFYLFFMFDL